MGDLLQLSVISRRNHFRVSKFAESVTTSREGWLTKYTLRTTYVVHKPFQYQSCLRYLDFVRSKTTYVVHKSLQTRM